MKLIQLTQGQFALVDDEDYERVSKFKWYAAGKSRGGDFYAMRRSTKNGGEARKNIHLHRSILNDPPLEMDVDHINHNTLDCRKSNLRACTKSQNRMNRRGPQKNSKTGLRGVLFDSDRGKFLAQIRMGGKNIYIGRFDSAESASAAYIEANKKYFGDFGGNYK